MGAAPSASYAITLRLRLDGDDALAVGRVTTTIVEAGGGVTAMDFVDSSGPQVVVDVTVNASGSEHAERITAAVDAIEDVEVRHVSDRTFLLHLHGKLEVRATVPLKTRDDLSMAYTPGVARVCLAIAERPEDARQLTIKGNTVAIVTDGSAVLGLGDIGPEAALPVMEGKAALFKRFAGVDAWPVCLDAHGVDEIVDIVTALAPTYGGINLEDISAPRCFEIEDRLRERLDIPVFHDDQHGTAIVALAALHNALRLVDKRLEDITVTVCGIGSAGNAIARLLLREGVGDVVAVDRPGILAPEMDDLDHVHRWLAERTNRAGRRGGLREAVAGSDVFIGVSRPDLLAPEDIATMRSGPIVFALANPDPEIDPVLAREHAAVVATGRSDQPNQINNVLAFPGVFRGALDARATAITDDMKVAAARALADVVAPDELRATYIIPSVFNERVTDVVAGAGRDQARRDRAVAPTS